ncbi:MAG: hypothetical protein KatS3mg014_0733 [Actinomycetota bacterium]|nr:MAG: hypothetical protein KatS3mg014_0733 [Actinomycetota bacterium]
MPLTGPYASDSEEMLQALEMAIDEYNAEGGLLGRKLTLVTCDVGALEVDTIQACAERLLGENPDAVITGYDDSGVNTLAFGEGDMPYLHAVTMRAAIEPVMDDPEKYGNVFQYDPSDYDYGTNAAAVLPDVAERLGFEPANRTVAVITTDYAYNAVGADAFIETIKQQGYDLALKEVIPFGVQEFLKLVQVPRLRGAAEGGHPLRRAGVRPNPEQDRGGGAGVRHVLGPGSVRRRAVHAAVDAAVRGHGDPEPFSIHPFVVRDAFDIWAQAVQEVGCVECYDKVVEAIRATDYLGFAGRYRFTPPEEGQYAMPGDDLLPTIWSQVQDAQNVVVLPDVAAEGTLQMPPWVPQVPQVPQD